MPYEFRATAQSIEELSIQLTETAQRLCALATSTSMYDDLVTVGEDRV